MPVKHNEITRRRASAFYKSLIFKELTACERCRGFWRHFSARFLAADENKGHFEQYLTLWLSTIRLKITVTIPRNIVRNKTCLKNNAFVTPWWVTMRGKVCD